MTEVKFKNKQQAIKQLQTQFQKWNNLLSQLSETQTKAMLYENRTIKDDLAHLWEWQRITVSRLEAALNNHEPHLDWIPIEFSTDIDAHTQQYNEHIFKTNQAKTWHQTYQAWKSTFQLVINLSRKILEKDLVKPGKYPWLDGYPLMAVLEGTYNHHLEHFPALRKSMNK